MLELVDETVNSKINPRVCGLKARSSFVEDSGRKVSKDAMQLDELQSKEQYAQKGAFAQPTKSSVGQSKVHATAHP